MSNIDLFEQQNFNQVLSQHNLLPRDGEAYYHGVLIPPVQQQQQMEELLDVVNWQHDKVQTSTGLYLSKRKFAFYADRPYVYRYSGVDHSALAWIETLLKIRQTVEKITQQKFNACLLNLYSKGNEAMSWHSDNEPQLKSQAPIACLSLGATRPFHFKHKTLSIKKKLLLESGSVLIMRAQTQRYWLHCVPKCATVDSPRISLTFRTMVD